MWRRLLTAGLLAIMILIIFSALSQAASPSSTSTISMQGQADVISNGLSPQIKLKANSDDSNNWLIEASFNVIGGGTSRYRENQVLNVSGNFTLGTENRPISNGTVTGWINTDGSGDIQLTDSSASTSLDMNFNVFQDGSMNSSVRGQWPALPSVQPVPSQPGNHFFWYLSRTAALIAYILLFLGICLGLGTKSSYLKRVWGPSRILDLHQFTVMLAGGFVLLHLFSLLGDTYYNFNLGNLLIPMSAPYRPLWTTLGIIGLYSGLVIALNSAFRKFIGQKTWRVLHSLSYVLFLVILIHGVMDGTDTTTPWVSWLYISTGCIIAFLFLWRFLSYRATRINKKLSPVSKVPKVA